MDGSKLPFNPKVDVFMPLYVGRFLQDTMHLDAQASGAYLHLLMHIWVRGPLPNDAEALARIGKCTPDAWSMCQASIMHYLKLGPDGMLHQAGAERLKEEWVDKRLKAHEKARNAANARWGKHKAKKAIPQALLEQCPTSEYEEQKQKQNLPPTPTAARRGIASPADAPSIPVASSTPTAGPAPSSGGKTNKSEMKAKSPERPHAGAPKPTNGAEGHHAPSNGRAVAPIASVGHPRKPVKAENGDSRRLGFEKEVLAFWRDLNPEYSKYTLTDPDRRALLELLRRHQDLTIAEFRRLLHNRAVSEINPAAAPHKWLRSILDYSAGPLGKFGKPLREARAL